MPDVQISAPLRPVPPSRGWHRRIINDRTVQIAAAGWLVTNFLLLALGGRYLPFQAPRFARTPTPAELVSTNAMFLEVFALMGVVHLVTRKRVVPDLVARTAERATTRRETSAVLCYGVLALFGGFLLGRGLGWHAFSLHLDGMVVPTGQPVVPAETLVWAGYNLLAYAILPYLFFRRRYTNDQLSLRSADRRADLKLIVVVLAIESTVQLSLNHQIFALDARALLLGAPLTFALSFAGTVLPTMIFVYCILTPRYLRLTGSVPATVVLGGVTYALLHVFDGWTSFVSPTDALLSVLYALLFYTGPGMFKTFITIRTANAWTHVWAYHAIAPHTLIDTPMFVRIFGIK